MTHILLSDAEISTVLAALRAWVGEPQAASLNAWACQKLNRDDTTRFHNYERQMQEISERVRKASALTERLLAADDSAISQPDASAPLQS